ncbi:MAG: hypothetical protein ABR612_05135 [Chromatocurvus sp.]
MHSTTGTFRSQGLLTTLFFTALLAAAVALAQPAAERDVTASSESPQDPATDNNGDRDSSETAGGDGAVVLSPFDYEASESISEDASVSFPVDI